MFPLADARGRVRGFQAREARRRRPAAGEVRQLARGRAVPQGRPRLRARPRAAPDREGGPGDRRRGLHRRPRAAPGRASSRSSPRWAPRSPRAAARAPAADARASSSASTPTPPERTATLRGMELARARRLQGARRPAVAGDRPRGRSRRPSRSSWRGPSATPCTACGCCIRAGRSQRSVQRR